ncbi:hypothetical protein D3C81_1188450 [compost metagenome]
MHFSSRILLYQLLDNMLNIPLAHRGLIRNNDPVRGKVQKVNLFFPLNEMHMLWGDPQRAFRLGMSLLADINNLVTFCDLLFNQNMRLGHIRTSGINSSKALIPSDLSDLRRYPVSRKDYRSFVYLTQNFQPVRTIQCDDPFIFKGMGHMAVMNDHTQYINRTRKIKVLGRLTGQDHCIYNAVTIASR